MRTIMLLNAKGGCGKSTLATNLASYYASQEKNVVLVDFDPQQSSMEWLAARNENYNPIEGIDGLKEKVKVGRSTDVILFDIPSVTHGKDLTAYVRKVDTIIIPVQPSPIDIRAVTKFVAELDNIAKVQQKKVKIAVVANRVKENTVVFHTLEEFLSGLKIPFIATLRDTQNYIRAADRGVGIFEMAPSAVAQDIEQWKPLVKWLNSKRSIP
jgi:chromosome partitioning protein